MQYLELMRQTADYFSGQSDENVISLYRAINDWSKDKESFIQFLQAQEPHVVNAIVICAQTTLSTVLHVRGRIA